MTSESTPGRRPKHRHRPAFDRVEARVLLSTFAVTNTGDSGPGTLRQAILDADNHPNDPGGRDSIVFAIPAAGVQTIAVQSDLPEISDPLLIDGLSQRTDAGTPAIVVDGTDSGGGDGLTVSAPNTTIQGLVVDNFGGSGIVVNPGASGALIRANYVGTDPTGLIAAGNGGDGVTLFADGATVGGSDPSDANVLSGNFGAGISLNEVGNRVAGNRIGTDPSGLRSVGNGGDGVAIFADGNTIGGPTFVSANVISGNGVNGVRVASNGNAILSNLIGTSFAPGLDLPASRFATIPNVGSGVAVGLGFSGNIIGQPGAGNLIAGNRANGILLTGQSDSNIIQGNGIGTTRGIGGGLGSGTAILSNGQAGIRISSSSLNSIGGDALGAGNVVSGNGGTGIQITGNDAALPGSPGNFVVGNVVGRSLDGGLSIPNGAGGIVLGNSGRNTVGGVASTSFNLISSNRGAGLTLTGATTVANVVLGNRIGTDLAGLGGAGNAGDGIDVLNASGNAIGAPGFGNLISANAGHGVMIVGTNATRNLLSGNTIGLSAAGGTLGNTGDGVHISAVENTIGGPTVGDRNVISGNQGAGIVVATETSGGVTTLGGRMLIQSNYIGPGSGGLVAGQGNQQDGILIRDSSQVSVVGNVVSGNRQSGIHALGNSTQLVLLSNIVGLNADGTRGASGNFLNGVTLEGVSGNVIGGMGPGSGNVLSGNGAVGLVVSAGSANLIVGNLVGTDPTGTLAQGNQGDGIALTGSSNNTLGGTASGARNVISGNASNGLSIVGPGGGNQVVGNLIGVASGGGIPLGNFLNGVVVFGASGNTIGGSLGLGGNVISANGLIGVVVSGSGASANLIQGNRIGTDATGAIGRGNALDGVLLDSASGNTVGGVSFGTGNLIAANGGNGVEIRGAGAVVNVVVGNTIGMDAGGQARLGNAQNGVLIDAASGNAVGGSAPGARNLISANGGNGVQIRNTGAVGNLISGNLIGTDATGAFALGNGRNGVELDGGANSTYVGTAFPGAGNLISGNLGSGVQLFSGAVGNVLFGNRIGTDAGGTRAVGNLIAGISLNNASDNRIGGDFAGGHNLVSGNGSIGIALAGLGATRNRIQGNLVGADLTGSSPIPNASSGISLDNAPGNTIGGAAGLASNVVVANRTFGIVLINSGASGNVVSGNFVGTDPTGRSGLGNSLDGILISAAPGNLIGGPSASSGNVVSGNGVNGIRVLATSGGVLQGNFVGVDPTGVRALGNAFDGILVDGSTGIVVVGSTRPGVISGNTRNGIEVSGASSRLTIQSNFIGTDVSGRVGLGNGVDGLVLANSSQNLVGGDLPAQGNLVSGNTSDGIRLVGAAGNVLRNNLVGTAIGGASALGNGGDGIALQGSPGNVVGGLTTAQGNVVSANGGGGIRVIGPGADGNVIAADTAGTDAAGSAPLGNANYGLSIEGASRTLVVGGVFSANGLGGVQVAGPSATANRLLGNTIGTDRSGRFALSNGFGIVVDGSGGNAIGGSNPGEGNLISGNTTAGVHLFGRFSAGNTVAGNRIGVDANGKRAITIPGDTPTQQVGILINEAPGLAANNDPGAGNTVGGTAAGARNVISGNVVGVEINGSGAAGNVILGNLIGPTIDVAAGAGNTVGVFINEAPGNIIGGAAANVISANSSAGVYILGNTATANVIAGNLIGTAADGKTGLGNAIGVYAENAPANTIGGTTAAARNVIGANATAGVYLLGVQSVGNAVLGNSIGVDATGVVQIVPRQLYGVLLYNAPNNPVARTGVNANKTAGSIIANFREFTGKTVVGNPSGSVGLPTTTKSASVPAGPKARRAGR